jgi:hypothetical protein
MRRQEDGNVNEAKPILVLILNHGWTRMKPDALKPGKDAGKEGAEKHATLIIRVHPRPSVVLLQKSAL